MVILPDDGPSKPVRSGTIRCSDTRFCSAKLLVFVLLLLAAGWSFAADDPADKVCPRQQPGSALNQPANLYSSKGELEVTLHFRRAIDSQRLTRYCYVTDDGQQSPTLHVKPGDRLLIHLRNDLPTESQDLIKTDPCNGAMSPGATNIHFHGTNIAPVCHQDEVIHTLIQPGQSFDYDVRIPLNASPGLYWYHPHPHGSSEAQVQGGATGALVIDGIEARAPSVSGLPEAVILLRDQPKRRTAPSNSESEGLGEPGWDLSVNYVPVTFPKFVTPVMHVRPAEQEFFRLANTAADSIFVVEYQIDGKPQMLKVVALDGVAIPGGPQSQSTVQLGPGARAEFILLTPSPGRVGDLISMAQDTGPEGESDPVRPLITVSPTDNAPELPRLGAVRAKSQFVGSVGLKDVKPTAERFLYFSEVRQDQWNFNSPVKFFVTVEGQTPQSFSMDQKPNIVLHAGTVEDWTIENRTRESHIFHIHQIHFQTLEIDGKPVNDIAVRDTIEVPWSETNGPYHRVKLRMDFRDPQIVGTFLYQCHIMQHEAGGMMGKIQVLPPLGPLRTKSKSSPGL